jgi:hypothetical protein
MKKRKRKKTCAEKQTSGEYRAYHTAPIGIKHHSSRRTTGLSQLLVLRTVQYLCARCANYFVRSTVITKFERRQILIGHPHACAARRMYSHSRLVSVYLLYYPRLWVAEQGN